MAAHSSDRKKKRRKLWKNTFIYKNLSQDRHHIEFYANENDAVKSLVFTPVKN